MRRVSSSGQGGVWGQIVAKAQAEAALQGHPYRGGWLKETNDKPVAQRFRSCWLSCEEVKGG